MDEKMKEVFGLVLIELEKAKKKHPGFPAAYSMQCMTIGEEYGELCQAVNDFMNCIEGATREHILEEAAHVAVVSLRTIEHLLKQKEQDGNEW